MANKKNDAASVKPLPQDVTLGALLVVLLASAFLIVLPRLHALRAVPQHYYNLLPVAHYEDTDRDGVPNDKDATPLGNRVVKTQHSAAEEEPVEN